MPSLAFDALAYAATRERVLARVRHSVATHREYRTVRHEQARWHSLAPGVTAWTLRDDAAVSVRMLRISDGCAVPWGAGVRAQELLVIEGALAGADGADRHQRHAHGVRLAGDAAQALSAAGTTLVYARHVHQRPEWLPALEARWWLGTPARWTEASRRRWRSVGEGVQVLPLHGDDEVASMLVRFAPGAAVADHRHALDEDCLVLEGEMFLGDILLRAGDYQLAPAGGGHVGECSERGVLFFFHGALDPALRPASGGRQPTHQG